jgi:transposase
MLLRDNQKILAYGKSVDMRKSWNGLLKLVKEGLKENPLDGTAYVFINKRGSLLKAVHWDRTGYVIVSKKLEVGKFFLSKLDEKQELKKDSARLLFDGISIAKRVRK